MRVRAWNVAPIGAVILSLAVLPIGPAAAMRPAMDPWVAGGEIRPRPTEPAASADVLIVGTQKETVAAASTSSLVLVDGLGDATAGTRFSFPGSWGTDIRTGQFGGPLFSVTHSTRITEAGGFLYPLTDRASVDLQVEIRPADASGLAPDWSSLLGVYPLTAAVRDARIIYASVAPDLVVPPGAYFALFVPIGDNDASFLGGAAIPFAYMAPLIPFWLSNNRVAATEHAAFRVLGERISGPVAGPTWSTVGTIPAATMVDAVGFDAGYLILAESTSATAPSAGSTAGPVHLWRSPTGKTWTPVTLPQSRTSGDRPLTARAIATNGRQALVVGEERVAGCAACAPVPASWISDDGRTWRAATLRGRATGKFTAVWSVPTGGWDALLEVAVMTKGTPRQVWHSADGLTWKVPWRLGVLTVSSIGLPGAGGVAASDGWRLFWQPWLYPGRGDGSLVRLTLSSTSDGVIIWNRGTVPGLEPTVRAGLALGGGTGPWLLAGSAVVDDPHADGMASATVWSWTGLDRRATVAFTGPESSTEVVDELAPTRWGVIALVHWQTDAGDSIRLAFVRSPAGWTAIVAPKGGGPSVVADGPSGTLGIGRGVAGKTAATVTWMLH